jgi:hypothetical protein
MGLVGERGEDLPQGAQQAEATVGMYNIVSGSHLCHNTPGGQ